MILQPESGHLNLPCKTEERKKEKVTYLLFVGGITEKEEKYTLKIFVYIQAN
jgi:hypothetical protein